MCKSSFQVLCIAGLVLISPLSYSQEKKPLWEFGAALGGLRAPAYIGAGQNTQRLLPLPYLIYRGEFFRVDEDGVGARLSKGENYEIDFSLGGGLGGGNQTIDLRKGMPKLGPSFEVGPRLTWLLAKPSTSSLVSLNLPLRAVFEFNSGIKNRGFLFEPNVRYTNDNIGSGVGFVAQAGMVWGSEKLHQHYYSVPPASAIVGRPAFNAKSGLLATRLSLAMFKDVNPNLSIGAFARADLSSNSASVKSPLHVKNNGLTVGFGINYTFAKSSTLVSW